MKVMGMVTALFFMLILCSIHTINSLNLRPKISKMLQRCVIIPSIAASIAISSCNSMDSNYMFAAATTPSMVSIERAVLDLEAAETRKDTLTAMGDVYTATVSKSMLAKSKYKKRIIDAVNDKHVKLNGEWDQALSFANGELKRSIDPFRTVDLAGYLNVAPFVGGACYLAALFIQQSLPELFIFAYPGAVFVFVIPALYIVFAT